MRINNNLAAINTHRQLGISSLNGAKSMEKLSSGFRINRAGDDAAGLAISEKMRGQIRGLNMASKNSSDTISLIQTAEGALSETHAILQRMRELSVQSANDTNTDTDRRELQAEIMQLKAEIDRIGNTTEFNTKKLLEGSAKGVADEIVGSMRINNNSGVIIDANKMNDMMKSVANDRNWAFDGAYMLIKTNQTYDSNGAVEYKASDFKLVGPDGTMYDFAAISQNTNIQASPLKAGTIVAGGGVVVAQQEKMAVAFTATGAIGKEVTLMQDVADGVTEIGAGSVLAKESQITLGNGSSITIGDYTFTENGGVIDISGLIEAEGADGEYKIGNATIIIDGAEITVISGELALTEAITNDGTDVTINNIAAGSKLSADTEVGADTTLQIEGNTVVSDTITIGASVDDTQMNLIAKGSILAQGTKVTLESGGTLDVGVGAGDWSISYDAGVMTITDNINTKVELGVGQTLTLDNGTVIRNNGGGDFEILSGSLKTANDMEIGSNVSSFNIASQSTIASGSTSNLKEFDLVKSSNYTIVDAGALNNNITIGNGVNLSNEDITHLAAGSEPVSGRAVSAEKWR
jgi:flagellin